MADKTYNRIIAQLEHGLIVSCQAPEGSPLARPEIISAFAETAQQHGACAVRIDSPENIAAVKRQVSIPVLGIYKMVSPESEVYITPTFNAARRIAEAGADIIALDATGRLRPGGELFVEIVEKIKQEFALPVMADVSTFAEGKKAEADGADLISTTLSGYTRETIHLNSGPDLELIQHLSSQLRVPLICEGRLRTTESVRKAFAAGAFSVVVGTAITGADVLVREFVEACEPLGRSIRKIG
jgi:N-acylglucosamine-6-phosphate 2-epimerase